VDNGALMLCIPAFLAIHLESEELDKRPVKIADGSTNEVPYVDPIRVDLQKRFGFIGAQY
jgi:hypothetical protein